MIKLLSASLLATALTPIVAFDGKGGWKTDDEGNLVKDDAGNPIWVKPDNSEQSVEGNTISRLNAEARDNRVRAEKAENDLKAFEGLDAKAAREALETVGKLDQKKLIDAGEVDRVKAEIKAGYDAQLAEATKQAEAATNELRNERLSNRFAGSKFIKDKIAIPVDMVQAAFAKNFEWDGDKIVAKGSDKNPIYSKKTMGEIADFDEALEILVDQYPNKDAILKGDNQSGTGNNGGGGNGGANKRRYARSEFDSLPPMEKANVAKLQSEGKAEIVDA